MEGNWLKLFIQAYGKQKRRKVAINSSFPKDVASKKQEIKSLHTNLLEAEEEQNHCEFKLESILDARIWELNELKKTCTSLVTRSKEEGDLAQEELETLKDHVTKVSTELVSARESEKGSMCQKSNGSNEDGVSACNLGWMDEENVECMSWFERWSWKLHTRHKLELKH
jgi:hypothetical protein